MEKENKTEHDPKNKECPQNIYDQNCEQAPCFHTECTCKPQEPETKRGGWVAKYLGHETAPDEMITLKPQEAEKPQGWKRKCDYGNHDWREVEGGKRCVKCKAEEKEVPQEPENHEHDFQTLYPTGKTMCKSCCEEPPKNEQKPWEEGYERLGPEIVVDGAVWKPKNKVKSFIASEITKAEERQKEKGYKANFLWPYDDDSLESLLYEFANAGTEGYRKIQYEGIVEKIKEAEERGRRSMAITVDKNFVEFLKTLEGHKLLQQARLSFIKELKEKIEEMTWFEDFTGGRRKEYLGRNEILSLLDKELRVGDLKNIGEDHRE